MDFKMLTSLHDRLYRQMGIHFDSYFTDTSLTSMQALTLEYILQHTAKREVFQKDLEEFLAIRGSSVSSLVSNLERNGYLQKESVDYDGRYKRLVPTEKAYGMEADISERINKHIESLFVGIPEQDLEVFQSVIEKMIKNTE